MFTKMKSCDTTKQSVSWWQYIYVCVCVWTSPGGNTPQDTNCTASCLPSWKLSNSKLDDPDMQDTAGEAGTRS